jgi:hypothetical protein
MTNKQHSLVKLAKETITNFVLNNEIIAPPDWLEEEYLKNQSGVFVTVKQNGELRGCIGTYLPTKENVAREIITNAIAAASEDPRFRPITENELDNIKDRIFQRLLRKLHGIVDNEKIKMEMELELEYEDYIENLITIANRNEKIIIEERKQKETAIVNLNTNSKMPSNQIAVIFQLPEGEVLKVLLKYGIKI